MSRCEECQSLTRLHPNGYEEWCPRCGLIVVGAALDYGPPLGAEPSPLKDSFIPRKNRRRTNAERRVIDLRYRVNRICAQLQAPRAVRDLALEIVVGAKPYQKQELSAAAAVVKAYDYWGIPFPTDEIRARIRGRYTIETLRAAEFPSTNLRRRK